MVLCSGASRPKTEARVKQTPREVLEIVQTETDPCVFQHH